MKQIYILGLITVGVIGYLLYNEYKSFKKRQDLIIQEITKLQQYHIEDQPMIMYEDEDETVEENNQLNETDTDNDNDNVTSTSFGPYDPNPHNMTLKIDDNMILNPKTGRYVKKDGTIGKKLMKEYEEFMEENNESDHESEDSCDSYKEIHELNIENLETVNSE